MSEKKTVCLVSGGYDPTHPGHLRMFEEAKSLGDTLVVALNSDDWLIRKKGAAFMPFEYRQELIEGLECVDYVIAFNDSDDTAIDALRLTRERNPNAEIIFCNGGDRGKGNVPEEAAATKYDVLLEYGVGGDFKLTASSVLLDAYTYPTTTRTWGDFKVLYNDPKYKAKELIINPGQCISKQYHYHRREIWIVISGTGRVINGDIEQLITEGDVVDIAVGNVHKLTNPGKLPLRIAEIQLGDYLEEDDIIRLDLDTLSINDKYNGTQGTK